MSKQTYSNVVTRVGARLTGWQQKVLSKAASSFLIRTVTSTITLYSMQSAKLHIWTVEELEKVNRNFFWHKTEEVRKMRLIS